MTWGSSSVPSSRVHGVFGARMHSELISKALKHSRRRLTALVDQRRLASPALGGRRDCCVRERRKRKKRFLPRDGSPLSSSAAAIGSCPASEACGSLGALSPS